MQESEQVRKPRKRLSKWWDAIVALAPIIVEVVKIIITRKK